MKFVPILDENKKLYIEKALCIIGDQPFYQNFKHFLKELYRIQLSCTDKPLERIICHFVDSLYTIPDKCLTYYIASKELKFYTPPIYSSECDINDDNIELLFIKLNTDVILLLWQAILLERKIFLISQSKSLLTLITTGLLSLTFPFRWEQATIPILPEKLRVFLDSPVPSIIGICFKPNMVEFPAESIVVNIDKCSVEKYLDKLPKLPQKFLNILLKRLEKYKEKYNNPDDLLKANNIDEAFNMVMDISDDDKVFDTNEIKDIFYEFFVMLFKNYESYFGFKNKKSKGKENNVFNKELFLKDHSSNDAASFLFKFSETIMFSQFIDSFLNYQSSPQIQFFIDSIKKEKKNKYYLSITNPTLSQVIPDIYVADLKNEKFFYKSFPKLNPKLYIKIDIPKLPYQSKFDINRDEWCFNISNLNQKDWAKYLIYVIYEIWFQMFSIIIALYDDKIALGLIEHGIFLLETLTKRKNITPSRSLYTKLMRACGRSTLSSKMGDIWKAMPPNCRQNNPLYYNAFMNGVYDLNQQMLNLKTDQNEFNNIKESAKTLIKKNSTGRISLMQLENLGELGIYDMLNSAIFVHYDICPNCYKNNKKKKLNVEEILGGFKKDKSTYYCTCNICLSKFSPKIYIIYDNNQKSLDIMETVGMLSPVVLLKEVDNLIKNKGEKYFFISEWYKHREHKQIFWNIVYYFNVLKLPTFVLTYIKNEIVINGILDELDILRQSANSKKVISSNTLKSNFSNTVGSNGTSRKGSFTSSVNDSNYAAVNKSSISNFNGYEIIYFKIIEKIENFLQNNKEIEKSPEDLKSEIMGNITELRNLMSKNIEEFISFQKERLEIVVGSFDSLYESNLSILKKDSLALNISKTMASDKSVVENFGSSKK